MLVSLDYDQTFYISNKLFISRFFTIISFIGSDHAYKMSSRYVDDDTYNHPYDYDGVASTYGTTGYDTGYGVTTYDPATGSYDQHLDYQTDSSRRHHRERLDDKGVYRHRDVDRRDDGTTHVHREYDNPNTGTSYHRDIER